MLDNPQLDARERAELSAVVDALAVRKREDDADPSSPARVPLDASAGIGGGIEVMAPDGRRLVLVRPRAAWVWPMIPAVVGVFVAVALAVGLWDAPGSLVLLVVGLVFVLFGAISAGTYVLGTRHVRRKLVFDVRDRVLREIHGGRAVLCIPARLVKRTRVEVRSDPGYADIYQVLVDLGVAELCIDRSEDPNARKLAEAMARYMEVPFDPSLERRGPP